MCCKSEVYVEDLRTVMIFQNRRLKYPKNYHDIVQNGDIITDGTDSEGNVRLKLLYGKKDKNGMRPAWTLSHIVSDECHSKDYYTMYELAFVEPKELHELSYEPFGFSRVDLEKYIPVIDVKRAENPNNPYQLVNTLYLTKKGRSVNEESGEVNDDSDRKEKGRNGKQLYNSTYDKFDPHFFVIRNDVEKVELDKTIVCFIISLFVYSVILIRKLLTFLPMKFGEFLLHIQNPITKILGHIFFTPFVPLKFVIDVSAVLFKMPILLFVANQKKYGDKYYVLWKHEFMECFRELRSDCSVIKNGKRPVTASDYESFTLVGTWDELEVRRRTTHKCEV